MTTIAACSIERVMCSDSGWQDGHQRGAARKVHRIRGDLLGMSGNLDEIQAWLIAYRAGEELTGKHVNAMRLSKDGRIDIWVLGSWFKVEEKFFAIGSGSMAARAAMQHKATVREAVRTAISLDVGSFGPVRTYKV